MRYAQIRKMDISNGEGIGVALFTQGCHFHCKGCHNPEQWSFDGGEEYTWEIQDRIIKLLEPNYITRLSILGGEPLEKQNWFQLSCLIQIAKIKKPSVKIWLYTGYTYESLLDIEKNNDFKYLTFILDNIDYLVDGPFIREKKDITLQFRGSDNQRILDMREVRS